MRHGILVLFLGAVAACSCYGQEPLYCASDDGGRHFCGMDTRGGVRLVKQVSGSACTEGYSWGSDNRGVWVDHGCRATFAPRGGWVRRDRDDDDRHRGPTAVLTCNSDDEGRHFCAADTRGGVRVLRQISGSPCREGYSWGRERGGIWVDHGCRAEFELGGGSGGGPSIINCSSDDGGLNRCPADTRGGVQLSRQISGSRCTEGYSWGHDRNGIWVDHGCRAEFQLGEGGGPRPGPGGWGWGGGDRNSDTVSCASDDGGRHRCSADTRGGVRMTRQISGSACTQGYSWGYDRDSIWVDHGCRAEFRVGEGGGGGWRHDESPGAILRCSSDDGGRHRCAADTRGGVRMNRQISGSACKEGYSWGWDRDGIWVDHGCRADFELGRR